MPLAILLKKASQADTMCISVPHKCIILVYAVLVVNQLRGSFNRFRHHFLFSVYLFLSRSQFFIQDKYNAQD